MVGTLGIVLTFGLAVASGVDAAAAHAQSWRAQGGIHRAGTPASQDPVPQEPAPVPKEQEPAPKPEEAKHPTVEGHVKLRDGRPAAGARIVAKGPEGTTLNATADGNGRFRFTGPEGSYSLEIQAADKNRTFQAAIKGGRLTPAEFTVE